MSMSAHVTLAFTFATITLLLIFATDVVDTATDSFFVISKCSGNCQMNSSQNNHGCRAECQCTPLVAGAEGHEGDCTNRPPKHATHPR
uniref:8 kDa Amblyomma family member n=1 Tax=Rhipicephalus appendiculatus TaxID=34631 RepID=A0A131YFS1_RHIAP